MGWTDVLTAIFAALKDVAVGFFLGQSRQQLEDLHNDLEAMGAANRAAVTNRARPVDERLRDAKQRGLYRLPEQSTND